MSRGWYKQHNDWVDEGQRKDVLEESERVGEERSVESRSRARA